MSNAGFLIAAYLITVVGLAAYYVVLRRQQAQVIEDLALSESDASADAG